VDRYAKAIVGAVMAFLGALGTGLADGHVTATEWVVAASAAVASLALVWGVPNSPARPPYPPAPDTVTTVNVGASAARLPTVEQPVMGRYGATP
jgi:hypothetical protein